MCVREDQQPQLLSYIGCVHSKKILEFVYRHKTVELEVKKRGYSQVILCSFLKGAWGVSWDPVTPQL